MSKSKKIIGMGLGLAVLVSSVGFAFAINKDSQSTSGTAKAKYQSADHFKGKGGWQRVDTLSSLVTSGTITADQQKAIQEAMKPTKDIQTEMKASLDKLVTAGTITQAQEDAVIKAYDAAKAQMQTDFKGKGEFEGEGHRQDILASLVTSGTITADQQKAIQEALRPTKDMQTEMKANLDKLVTAGTITQAQEDAVIKAYDASKTQMQAEQEKRLEEIAKEKGITVEQLKAQMEEHKPEMGMNGEFKGRGHGQKLDILASLVTAGTITADQQKVIQEAMKPTKDSQTTMKASLDKLVTAGTITQTQEDAVIKAIDAAKVKMQAEHHNFKSKTGSTQTMTAQ